MIGGDQAADHVLHDVLVKTLQLPVIDDPFLEFFFLALNLLGQIRAEDGNQVESHYVNGNQI